MITDFSWPVIEGTTWKICGFNKMVPYDTREYGLMARQVSRLRNLSFAIAPLGTFSGAMLKTAFKLISL